jgi:hypothetical protein
MNPELYKDEEDPTDPAPPKLSPLSLSLPLFYRLQLDDIHLEGYYYNVEENLKP